MAAEDLEDARIAVAQHAAQCAQAFGAASSGLGEVMSGLTALSGRMEELSALLGPLGGGMDEIAAAASALRSRISDTAAAGASSAVEAVWSARAALQSIALEAQRLAAISSLTMVTARSYGATGLDAYVTELRGFIGELEAEAGMLERAVVSIAESRDRSAALDRAAISALDALASSLAGSVAARRNLDHAAADARDRILNSARTVRQASAEDTGRLIAGMQFADEFSQRIEHVQIMLARSTGREAAVRALASAQLAALASDGLAVREEADRSLSRLSLVSREAMAALGEGGGNDPVAGLLVTRRSTLAAASRHHAAAAAATTSVAEIGVGIRERIGEARARFGRLREASAAIGLSAINAALLTARSGASRAALGVLAVAVQASAETCALHASDCEKALDLLARIFDEDAYAATLAAVGRFTNVVSLSSGELASADGAIARLRSLRSDAAGDAAALERAILSGQEALGGIAPASGGISQVGQRLGAGAAPGGDILEDIHDLYTMEQEREVHRRVLGGPAPSPAATLAMTGTAGDLDSIFF